MIRRDFLLATLNALFAPALAHYQDAAGDIPAFAELDKAMHQWLDEKQVPGAALSIVYRGRLLFAKGYGYAEVETKAPCAAGSVFRIGSVSKFVTAVCILKLVEQGKIRLTTSAIPFLAIEPYLPPNKLHDRTDCTSFIKSLPEAALVRLSRAYLMCRGLSGYGYKNLQYLFNFITCDSCVEAAYQARNRSYINKGECTCGKCLSGFSDANDKVYGGRTPTEYWE